MNAKEMAENVLTDLMGDKSVSDILLKMKIFASVRKDEDLLTWVSKELGGYFDEAPPSYRILDSGLKVKVFVPYNGEHWIEFPAEMIEEENVSERLSKIPFHQPIAELERLSEDTDNSGTINIRVPVYAFPFISKHIRGDIQDAYQYSTKAALSQIVVSVKSVLIDFLLKIGNEEKIDFNTFIKNYRNMDKSITINAQNVNTGSGTIHAEGASSIVGNNNTLVSADKENLLKIIAEIDKIATDHNSQDYQEVSADIKEELQKEKPDKKFLKRCFQLIPTFLSGVASSAAGNGLTSLISSALALL